MTIWLDNQLSPALARWIEAKFGVPSIAIRDLGMARASDLEVFSAAKASALVLMTKDRDFAELSERLGPPPAVILLSLGNTSTEHLVEILATSLPIALELIAAGEALIEATAE